MSNPFFDHPILNSPYEYPRRHWELDEVGQPTQRTIDSRRSAKFVTPIPKPKKHKAAAQKGFVFDEGKGLSTKEQQYDPTSIINEVRSAVDIRRRQVIEHPLATPGLGRDFSEPYRCFDRLNLAKERANIIELVVPPVLKEPCGFRRDLPLTGIR